MGKMKHKNEKLYSASEVAEILDVTVRWIRRLCEDDRLGQLLGNRWVITEKEVETYRKSGRPPKVRSRV